MSRALRVDNIEWEFWQPTDHAVLCFLRNGSRLLLIHKKRGLGRGKINGPGGRIEAGETAIEAAVRETREEVGLEPLDPSERAELSFVFADGYGMQVRVFFAARWRGTLTETDEALPFWCDLQSIPYDQMWADDRLWLPHALEGRFVRGVFTFDGDRMIDHRVTLSAP